MLWLWGCGQLGHVLQDYSSGFTGTSSVGSVTLGGRGSQRSIQRRGRGSTSTSKSQERVFAMTQ